MKWRLFHTLAIVALLALLSLSAACSDDDDAPQPATATPTGTTAKPDGGSATPAFRDCPDSNSVCAFATYVNTKFEAKDFAAVVREAVPRDVTCKADYNQGLDPDASVCRGKPAGTKVVAYDAGRTYSEGYRTTAEGLEGLFRDYATKADATLSDDYGSGAFRMYSIGRRDCPDCREKLVLVFSRIAKLEGPASGPRDSRDALLLYLSSQGSAPEVWKIDLVLTGVQLGPDIPFRLGGGNHPDGTLYAVWNPKDGTKPAGPGPIWLGAAVNVKAGGDCLNVRKEPSKSGAVVTCLKDGELVLVTGPSKQADGLKWWPVRPATGADAAQRAGWASSEFLAPTVR